MTSDFFTYRKISQIFAHDISKKDYDNAVSKGQIPSPVQKRQGNGVKYGHFLKDLPQIGQSWGFLKPFSSPAVYAVFTTKGGVLKTTLSLNLARTSALHNIKTCVIGLDMQGDITTALGHNADLEDCEDIQEVITKLNGTKGLADVFNGTARLKDVILPTELPSLFYIPETPELVAFNESVSNINRREYWLKEKIIDPLKEDFDVIIMDCSPNWNRLITNALVSCDALISPLECKINNFRNFRVFKHFLSEFKQEMKLNFDNIFVPTRYGTSKKLTLEIRQWYESNVEGCTQHGIRESVSGEEATALRASMPEHVPTKAVAQEIRDLLKEIQQRTLQTQKILHKRSHIKRKSANLNQQAAVL